MLALWTVDNSTDIRPNFVSQEMLCESGHSLSRCCLKIGVQGALGVLPSFVSNLVLEFSATFRRWVGQEAPQARAQGLVNDYIYVHTPGEVKGCGDGKFVFKLSRFRMIEKWRHFRACVRIRRIR